MADYQGQYTGPQVDERLAKAHEHSNKALLDTYTQTEVNLADAVSKKHAHTNKSVLDAITDVLTTAWSAASTWVTTNGAAVLAHLADTVRHITATERTAWDGKYTKPSAGIPKADLASDVQTSLGKADTALQSHQSLAAYRTSAQQDVIDATKASKASSPTAGHLASLDAQGNVTDSGVSADDLEAFIVNFTINLATAQITACDKTYVEIAAAWAAGKHIVAMTNVGMQLVLVALIPSYATFTGVYALTGVGLTGLTGAITIGGGPDNVFELIIEPFTKVPQSHTANHLTVFDANGNLLDAGVTADDLKEFAVNITGTIDAGGNYTITSADKTYAQILAAITAKRHVIAYVTVTAGEVSMTYQIPYTGVANDGKLIFCTAFSNWSTLGCYVSSANVWNGVLKTIMEKPSSFNPNEIGIFNADGNVISSGKTMADLQSAPTTESKTIAASDWSALSSSSPYTQQATVTAVKTITANTIVELINDNAVNFATYGYAIGSISGQSVVIYAISAPSASVTLKLNIF